MKDGKDDINTVVQASSSRICFDSRDAVQYWPAFSSFSALAPSSAPPRTPARDKYQRGLVVKRPEDVSVVHPYVHSASMLALPLSAMPQLVAFQGRPSMSRRISFIECQFGEMLHTLAAPPSHDLRPDSPIQISLVALLVNGLITSLSIYVCVACLASPLCRENMAG